MWLYLFLWDCCSLGGLFCLPQTFLELLMEMEKMNLLGEGNLTELERVCSLCSKQLSQKLEDYIAGEMETCYCSYMLPNNHATSSAWHGGNFILIQLTRKTGFVSPFNFKFFFGEISHVNHTHLPELRINSKFPFWCSTLSKPGKLKNDDSQHVLLSCVFTIINKQHSYSLLERSKNTGLFFGMDEKHGMWWCCD